MKTIKRCKSIISLLVAFVVILGTLFTLSSTVFAESSESDFEYEVNKGIPGYYDDSIRITKYIGKSNIVNIPEQINGITVTSLGRDVFKDSSVLEINLPKTPIRISNEHGEDYFECETLEKINVDSENKSLVSVEGVLFSRYENSSGETILTLEKYPQGKKGDVYTILEGTSNIYNSAFKGNSFLQTINIGKNVRNIGFELVGGWYPDTVFENCVNLENINVDKENKTFYSDNGVLYYFADESEENSLANGNTLLIYPQNKKDKKFNVPSATKSFFWYSFRNNPFIEEIIWYSNDKISISQGAIYSNRNLKRVILDAPNAFMAGTSDNYDVIVLNRDGVFSTGQGIPLDFKSDKNALYGYIGSSTEKCAKENDIRFVAIEDKNFISNDIEVLATLESSAALNVDKISNGDIYNQFKSTIGDNQDFLLYNLSLNSENTKTRSTINDSGIFGNVTIKIAIPKEYDKANISVYKMTQVGNITKINAIVDNDYMIFETDNLGMFAIADLSEKTTEPPITEETTNPPKEETTNEESTTTTTVTTTQSTQSTTTATNKEVTNKNDIPKTGDNSSIAIIMGISIFSMGLIFVLYRKKKIEA